MNTHHFRAEKDEKQMRGNYYTFPCATWLIASLFLRFYLSLDNRISENAHGTMVRVFFLTSLTSAKGSLFAKSLTD